MFTFSRSLTKGRLFVLSLAVLGLTAVVVHAQQQRNQVIPLRGPAVADRPANLTVTDPNTGQQTTVFAPVQLMPGRQIPQPLVNNPYAQVGAIGAYGQGGGGGFGGGFGGGG